MADPDNPFFARAQVNRVWLHLMGRGLVDPNDDFRATNPPTNPELLDYLAKDFAAGGFRLKPLVRHDHDARGRTSSPSTPNDAERWATSCTTSHALVQPLEAEQLLDALAQVTGVPVQFTGYPLGLRADQVPAPPQSGRRGDVDGDGRRGS